MSRFARCTRATQTNVSYHTVKKIGNLMVAFFQALGPREKVFRFPVISRGAGARPKGSGPGPWDLGPGPRPWAQNLGNPGHRHWASAPRPRGPGPGLTAWHLGPWPWGPGPGPREMIGNVKDFVPWAPGRGPRDRTNSLQVSCHTEYV